MQTHRFSQSFLFNTAMTLRMQEASWWGLALPHAQIEAPAATARGQPQGARAATLLGAPSASSKQHTSSLTSKWQARQPQGEAAQAQQLAGASCCCTGLPQAPLLALPHFEQHSRAMSLCLASEGAMARARDLQKVVSFAAL